MTAIWIVGVDGSETSRHAAEWAVDQAVGRDARIVLLATWTAPSVSNGLMPTAMASPDWSDLESELQRSTDSMAAEVARDGVVVEARTAHGPAAQLLIDASRDADLLVIGGRGLGRVKALLLGSVSQHCVSHAVVPTAVIEMEVPLGRAARIVVGYDGSPNARSAAQWALDFAAQADTVTIIDALAVAPWLAADVVRQRFPEEVGTAESEFQTHMSELDPDGRATHSFLIADERIALLEASQEADLLVLGARGRGGVGEMLLGSTTTWLLQDATCATVVVPHRRD